PLVSPGLLSLWLFYFNDPSTPALYPLSLHDALPICHGDRGHVAARGGAVHEDRDAAGGVVRDHKVKRSGARQVRELRLRQRLGRSEEHTSELQSLAYLVCRLLLEKKKYDPFCVGLAT